VQAIGFAIGGKLDNAALSELIPDYDHSDDEDEEISDKDLADQAAAFFGYPTGD
jgi:hypothetical protein